ncbi:hypothetical protein MAR_028016 [Mya arenaria]|uniref:Uncharacterized protein n=1 Tax=Mya arenaria TaxID=6604 RepID=A0ABY7DCD1_MYAAR|nr:hypothetical protein MAR_028016 [Mya arenaria]
MEYLKLKQPAQKKMQSFHKAKKHTVKKDRDDIEMYTRGQNKNDRWFEEGKKIFQSSHFHCVCTATERTDLNDLAKILCILKQGGNH